MNVLVGVISPFGGVDTAARVRRAAARRISAAHLPRGVGSRTTIRGVCCRRPTSRSRRSSIATSFRRSTRLRWVQSPAVGVGSLLFPDMLASPSILTSARGIRARAIAEHVLGVTIALARQLPAALRAQAAHTGFRTQLEGSGRARSSRSTALRMGIVGLGAIGIEGRARRGAVRLARRRRSAAAPADRCRMASRSVCAPERLPLLLAKSDVVVLARAADAGNAAG